MSVESVLVALILSSVLASVFFGLTRALDALNGSGFRNPRVPKEEQWRTRSGP